MDDDLSVKETIEQQNKRPLNVAAKQRMEREGWTVDKRPTYLLQLVKALLYHEQAQMDEAEEAGQQITYLWEPNEILHKLEMLDFVENDSQRSEERTREMMEGTPDWTPEWILEEPLEALMETLVSLFEPVEREPQD